MAAMLVENQKLLMLLTTSVAILIGCVVVLVWCRSSSQRSAKGLEPPKLVIPKVEPEEKVDDGKKVTIFFVTQTGTAEGFAKAFSDEAKARYEKAKFKATDLGKENRFSNLQYGVFGLGNRQYEHFNKGKEIAKVVDNSLTKQGAKRLVQVGMGDDDQCMEDGFTAW